MCEHALLDPLLVVRHVRVDALIEANVLPLLPTMLPAVLLSGAGTIYFGKIAIQDPRSSTPGLQLFQWINASKGEGTAAFLEKLTDELMDRNANKLALDANGWRYEWNGHQFAANYDASESNKGKRANELLDETSA